MTKYDEYLLTEGREHILEESRFELLKEKVEKLTKKFGEGFISINVIKEDFQTESGITYKYITFVLNHIFSHLNDWKVLARKSNINNSVLIDVFEDSPIVSDYRNDNFSCDHCSSNRVRKFVFIIQNQITKEVKQVGKTCLKDFTGESVTRFLKEVEAVESLFQIEGSANNSSFGYCDLIKFFAMVNRLIKKGFSYKNRSFNNESTVNISFENYLKENLPITEEEKEVSKELMKWFIEYNKNSDKEFILNAVTMIENALNSNQLFNYELLFRVAFVPYSYKSYLIKQSQINLVGFKGGYLSGSIKDKIDLQVKLISIKPILRQSYSYEDEGISYLYTLLDKEGHKIVWFSSYNNKFFQEENLNKVFRIKGIIKKFSKFNGLEHTEISRCFVTMI